ncbi:MAG TPA: transposase [Candidatus Acidoferrum sp.]|nr:transposase [Candidatus Acidoferrum sp.]
MRFAYKYRLYPSKAQVEFFENQLHEACELYNAALQERRDAWKVCRKHISYYDQVNQLKQIRAEGLLGLANFSCCQDVLRRLDKTFQAFFARVRRGEKPGFPRFRSFRRYDSITFPSYGDGCRLLDDGKLRIQGAGLLKVKLHRPVEGQIKTVTIKRDVNHGYVCFSVERDTVPFPESSKDVGIDVGLDSFAALSNGMEIDKPRHFKRGLAHLRRAQRRQSRRKRTSHRRRKAVTLVGKAHRKIRNQRAAFHHDLSRWLVERFGLIAVEDLNIKGRSRGMLAGLVHDAGWNSFFAKLWYKAASAGRELGEGRSVWNQPNVRMRSGRAQDSCGALA